MARFHFIRRNRINPKIGNFGRVAENVTGKAAQRLVCSLPHGLSELEWVGLLECLGWFTVPKHPGLCHKFRLRQFHHEHANERERAAA